MVSSSAKSEHFALWQACFGDTHEEIKLFLRAADSSLLAECRDGDELAGMALLVPATVRGKPAYYGYAVCTAEKHRKRASAAHCTRRFSAFATRRKGIFSASRRYGAFCDVCRLRHETVRRLPLCRICLQRRRFAHRCAEAAPRDGGRLRSGRERCQMGQGTARIRRRTR